MTTRSKRRMCYGCGQRPPRPRSYFCSDACGCAWADELTEGNDPVWCPTCGEWSNVNWGWEAKAAGNDGRVRLTCGHLVTEKQAKGRVL